MTVNTAGNGAADLSPLKRAYLALEQLQAKCEALEQGRSEPIAVVGMACRFPGGADDPEAYWRLLRSGTDAICDVPPGRWDVDAYYDPDPAAAGKMHTRSGGFLQGVDLFDPQFFGISPREADSIDPQHRLLLETSWEALENAAQVEDRLAASPTGVFVGITSHDYADLHFAEGDLTRLPPHLITGNSHNAAAGRISYTFGFQGPALAVDTACSSSLVAIHLACRSLLDGECDRALAAGVNLILTPLGIIALGQGGVLAPDGRCRAFDAAASGMVRGEGCAVVVLKRLSRAVADRDNIVAVIRSTAVNQDGPSSGLTVPNGPAQEMLIRQALVSAGLKPGDIDYIEAHGTGTQLGDPIELRALAGVFGSGREHPLVLGSVKTNFGHLESCAGIAGFIKVVLSLQQQEIPPHLHFRDPTPHLPWSELPFVVPTAPRAWASGARPRRAGVSSFGISGINAHVVLEEAPVPAPARSGDPDRATQHRPLHLLALSGRLKAALQQSAERFADHLERHPTSSLGDVCFSAAVGRAHSSHRLAVLATSMDEARGKLAAFNAGPLPSGVHHGSSATPPKVAFLFTGQGSQYRGMGRELCETQPLFRETLRRCDEILRPLLHCSLIDALYGSSPEGSRLDETLYAQPALFAVEYALAELWRSWGVRPAVVLGHSVGEYVAACVAGVFSLEDGLRLIAERARLMQGLPREGAMIAISAHLSEVERIIRPYASTVCIAAHNAPGNVVISGEQAAVAIIAQQCESAGIRSQSLAVSHAFHSHLMDPILDAFERKVQQVALATPRIGFISNLQGTLVSSEITQPGYWRRHLREAVRFAQGMAVARERGCSVFLELGPKPTLLGLGQQCIEDQDVSWLPSLRPGGSDWQQMLSALAELYVRGARIDWSAFEEPYRHRRVALPTTPFQRQRYWLESHRRPDNEASAVRRDGRAHPLLGSRLALAGTSDICFQSRISRSDPVFLQDHVVFEQAVLPASAYLEIAIAAACEAFGCERASLEDVTFQQALRFSEQEPKTLQTVLKREGARAGSFEIYSRNEMLGSDSWVRHAAGRCRAAEERNSSQQPALPSAVACDVIDGAVLYERTRACGVDLGPRFQALQRAWRRDADAFGEIMLPQGLVSGARKYHLHPVLLDACLQAMGALFADRGDRDLHLPVALDRLTILGPAGTSGWSRAHVELIGAGSEQALSVDVQVIAADGSVAAELKGLQLKRTNRHRLESSIVPELAAWLYEVRWVPAALEIAHEAAVDAVPTENRTRAQARRERDHWLLMAPSDSTLADVLRERIERSGDLVTLAHPGAAYCFAEDGAAFLDPADPAHMRALFDELAARVCGRPTRIVHLWGLCPEAAADFSSGRTDRAYSLGWGSALHLVQAITSHDGPPPRLWLVTQNAQGVDADCDLSGLAQAPLFGFAKVANLEYPELGCVNVDLDSGSDARAAACLFDEIRLETTEDQVAFRGNQRYVARLARHSGAAEPRSSPVRSDATYLVTGGHRGLGLQTAQWLVERGARSLMLVSRNEPDPENLQRVIDMRRAGAVVETACCDVSDADQVARLLARIAASGPPLRGIVHAAGLLEDATLAQENADRFRRVLAPKLLGGWHLHRLTREQPLDFFLLYSSMASLLGSPGQANYAAANAFLDALAHHRRGLGLAALSINWGPWSEIGLAARHQLEPRMRTRGFGMVAPQQGMHVLEYLLSRPSAQVGVAPIDWSVLAQRSQGGGASPFFSNFREFPTTPAAQPSHGPTAHAALRAAAPEERLAKVTALLCAEIASVLRLAPEDVDMHQPLNRIGLDSLMAVELRNRLRFQLGLDVPLVTFMQDTSIAHLAAELSARVAAGTPAQVEQPADGSKSVGPEAIAPRDIAPLLDRLDQLTDDEVDAWLGAALAGKLPDVALGISEPKP
jgi:acyl transferase domain-containing protein